jgi:hypothetical protein
VTPEVGLSERFDNILKALIYCRAEMRFFNPLRGPPVEGGEPRTNKQRAWRLERHNGPEKTAHLPRLRLY